LRLRAGEDDRRGFGTKALPAREVWQVKAISVRQPWAWLLIHGGKSIENRDWYTGYRGPLAIHAASAMSIFELYDAIDFVRRFDPALAEKIPNRLGLVFGAVIGTVEQVGCFRESFSMPGGYGFTKIQGLQLTGQDLHWFQGRFGHVYQNPRELLVPVSSKDHLNIWEWEVPEEGLRYVDQLCESHA
jgi:hypothetical protein